ncbi:DUF2939 domain-containing protein [Imhoffiella purpurea]|uniref:DUF2939 domain-containing protein n=1 Tax=Imhoffiella purpurea TaxID=1249627 RepID=W9V934_9GAMM|nr:DUF2939 domain-containing protein [Imhoffiella purpurea]EXJ15944.1 hypothetical protein D779_0692 [Imhoffiella purpurea]
MRFIGYLILLAAIGYGLWPYYSVYRLDDAISLQDKGQLAEMLDLRAIRANYKQRIAAGVKDVLPAEDPNSVMGWLRQNIDRLGDTALEQAITVDWARQTLRDAVTRATGQTPPYLLAAVDYAFFESFDRFLIRIGELGRGAAHVRLGLVDGKWKITDIIP